MKIYTRTGDKGETSLFDGRRVSKHDPRPDTYGTVDELNTVVGLAGAHCRHPDLGGLLELDKPVTRVRYELAQVEGRPLAAIVAEALKDG